MAKPNIVIVGQVCIDDNQSEHASYKGWGSSVIYMSQYLQRAYDVGPVAITSYGPDMLQYFPDITIIPAQPNREKTLIFENDSRTGKRVQHCRNIEYAGAPEITPEVVGALKQADIVIITPLLANYAGSYVKELLDHTKQSSLKVLCPQGYFRRVSKEGLVMPKEFTEAQEILPLFDLMIYSEEDHPEAFSLAQQWKRSLDTEIVVTQSSRGASIIEREGALHVPTVPIPLEKIIDSVGCGDVFAVATCYGYHISGDLAAAIKIGHRAARKKLLATNP